MTDFESIACKVMGLMLVVMLLILYLQLMGCSPPQESTRDFIDEVNMENYA